MTTTEELEKEQEKLQAAFERARAAIKAGSRPSGDDLWTIAKAAGANIRQRALIANKGPTAKEIAATITKGVHDILGDKYLFHAEQGAKLGDHDTVMVAYASVPKGSPELDALNAKTNPMWHITEAKGHYWYVDGPSPAKITIEMFRGDIRKVKKHFDAWTPEGKAQDKANTIKFRAKTDSPEKVIKYLLDFIKKNREVFLP